MSGFGVIAGWQSEGSAGLSWFAFDYLMLGAISAASFLFAWGLYRGWLRGWASGLRHPLHLRVLAAVAGVGLWIILSFVYIFSYKRPGWDVSTFLTILFSMVAVWVVLLVVQFLRGRKIRV